MSIDWEKAKEKPDKTQKILNSYLLDIKEKIDDLERRGFELKEVIQNKNNDLIKTKMKLANATNFLKELLENYTAAKKNLKILKKEKKDSEAKIIELQNSMKLLEERTQTIPDLRKEIEEQNNILKRKNEELDSLKETFESKIYQIKDLKTEILDKDDEISELNSTLKKNNERMEALNETFDSKIHQIKELKTQLLSKEEIIENKTHKIKQLKFQMNMMDKKTPERSTSEDLIEKIEEVLKLKGFLSEKELEMLKSGKTI